MFGFLTNAVRRAVRVATRDAAANGFAEGLADFNRLAGEALAEAPPDLPEMIRGRIRDAVAGTAAIADKPRRGGKAKVAP